MHHFGAFIFLAMVIGVILFVSSKAQKRRPVSKNYRSGGTSSQRPTYASQNHSSNDSSSLGYSSSGYSSSTSSNDSGNHEAERREIDRYDRLIEDAQKDIEYQEEAKRDYVRYRDEARQKGGKVGLYSAEEYEDFIRDCDYKIDDLKRRKKEYEADRDRIRRSIR